MLRSCLVVSTLGLSLALIGCASMADAPVAREKFDTAKMASIERTAIKAGVRVIWINPPEKREP